MKKYTIHLTRTVYQKAENSEQAIQKAKDSGLIGEDEEVKYLTAGED